MILDILNRVLEENGELVARWAEELARDGGADMAAIAKHFRTAAARRAPKTPRGQVPPRPTAPRAPRAPRAAPGQSQARQAPTPAPDAIAIATAACILGEATGIAPSQIIQDPQARKRAIRAATSKFHPDKPENRNLDPKYMGEVTQAMKTLDPRILGGKA